MHSHSYYLAFDLQSESNSLLDFEDPCLTPQNPHESSPSSKYHIEPTADVSVFPDKDFLAEQIVSNNF
jgi:hypothetical protein